MNMTITDIGHKYGWDVAERVGNYMKHKQNVNSIGDLKFDIPIAINLETFMRLYYAVDFDNPTCEACYVTGK